MEMVCVWEWVNGNGVCMRRGEWKWCVYEKGRMEIVCVLEGENENSVCIGMVYGNSVCMRRGEWGVWKRVNGNGVHVYV